MMPEPAIAISRHPLVPNLDENLVRILIVDMSPKRGLRDLKPRDSPSSYSLLPSVRIFRRNPLLRRSAQLPRIATSVPSRLRKPHTQDDDKAKVTLFVLTYGWFVAVVPGPPPSGDDYVHVVAASRS